MENNETSLLKIQSIGSILRNYRIKRALTLSQLSTNCDLSLSYLSAIEKGQRTPNIDILERICDAIGIPLEVILILASNSKDNIVNDRLKPLIEEIVEEEYFKIQSPLKSIKNEYMEILENESTILGEIKALDLS